MRRTTLLLLWPLLLWLQATLWFGKCGLQDYIRLKQEVAACQRNKEMLRARNMQLLREINDLVNGLEAVEEHARNDLGMVKPDENFYQFFNE